MKRRKWLFLIPIPILIAVFVILIQPKETLIQETMRFYSSSDEDVRGYPDDTDFGAISYEYIDANIDLTVQRNVFSAYVSGTMDIGGEKYYLDNTNVSDDSSFGGIYVKVNKKKASLDASHLRISDNLDFMELCLFEGDDGHYWFNCSTLGEFREGIRNLYPYHDWDI